MLTDDSGKHCLNRKQPEITFREQQNLSRSVCRTQKSRFLHEPASLEPENVMFGTPRIALLKKERCCCKYDLILQQPRTVCIIGIDLRQSPKDCSEDYLFSRYSLIFSTRASQSIPWTPQACSRSSPLAMTQPRQCIPLSMRIFAMP